MMKFGIILEASSLGEWQHRIIEDIRQKHANLEIVIDVRTAETATPLPSGFLYKTWIKFASKKLTSRQVNFFASSSAETQHVLSCAADERQTNHYSLDPETVATIKSLGLDFILYLGNATITGNVLDAARYGVWRFHHGDGQKYRAQPSCFWEMFNDENEIGGVLQRITDVAGTEVVLQRFSVSRDRHSWSSNINAIREASIPMVGCAIVDIVSGALDPQKKSEKGPSAVHALPGNPQPNGSLPTNLQMLRFFYLILRSMVGKVVKRVLFTHHWQIALCKASIDEILADGIRKILILESGGIHSFFYADPFVLAESTHSTSLLVERYDWRARKGVLKKIDVSTTAGNIEATAEYPVLETSSHLSYPLVVRTDGKIFMIPESGKARCIALHEIDAAAVVLNSTTIIDNAELVDPTILYHGAKYWLFASNRKGELYIWHSTDLQAGWKPHAKQPVLVSPSLARGAGNIFVHDNQLIRPTQDCSQSYGKQVLLNRITALDERSFAQEVIATIPPVVDGVAYDGLHTFNGTDGNIFVDVRTLHLNPLKPLQFVVKAIRSRLGSPVSHNTLTIEPRRNAAALDD